MDVIAQLAAALAGRYTIEKELGAGGMATVYLAQDVRHDRDVAIKVLHPDLGAALGGERFLAEIKTTARLQHPHILPLLDSGEAFADSHRSPGSGLLYYVMPVVTGESLRDRLARERQLPIADAVRIAREVASALDYAHRHGVIHRDIKPENILLHDGSAIVADFGIALAVQSASGPRMTQTGLSLGTPQYMSPEQAMGERNIDARADIYALGAMTYEMLTGDPPFTGSSAQAIVAKVLTERPTAPHVLRDTIPPHVEQGVLTALAKLPADRFATAAAFGDAIGASSASSIGPAANGMGRGASLEWDTTTPAAPRARRNGIAAVIGGAVAAAVVAVLVTHAVDARRAGGATTATETRFTVPFPSAWKIVMGGLIGPQLYLSPSGDRLVARFVRSDSSQLFARRLDELTWRPIPGTTDVDAVSLSNDGQFIVARRGSKILRLPMDGGAREELASGASFGAGTMSADGVLYVPLSYNLGLSRIASPGAKPVTITQPDSTRRELGHWMPQLLPDGRHILYSAYATPQSRARIEVVNADGTGRTVVVEGGLTARYAAGYLFFTRGDVLFAAPFDPVQARTTAAPQAVLDGIASAPVLGIGMYAVAASGTLAFIPREVLTPERHLVWMDRAGHETPVAAKPGVYSDPRLSYDGSRVAVRVTEHGFFNLYALELARGILTPISQREAATTTPVWSRDGRWLYYSVETPIYDIYRRASDGSQPESLVYSTPFDKHPTSISLDDRQLLITERPAGSAHSMTLATDGSRRASPLIPANEAVGEVELSPDGRWIVYGAGRQIYVRPYPDVARSRTQVTVTGGGTPRWTRGGRELVFRDGPRMMSVSFDPATGKSGTPQLLFTAADAGRGFDVTADGSRFLLVGPAPSDAGGVVVVVNWVQGLGRKSGR